MLAASPAVAYIHEPFNPNRHRPGICSAKFDYWFTYVTKENEERFYRPLKGTVLLQYDLGAALRNVRDPRTLARTVKNYTRLVVDKGAVGGCSLAAVRGNLQDLAQQHPAAFVGSLKRQRWSHPFWRFLDQPNLMRDHLGRFREQIAEYAERPDDINDQACLLWRIIYDVVNKYKASHNDWIFLHHEDISRDPIGQFRLLYGKLRLQFTSAIKKTVERHSCPPNLRDPAHSDDLTQDSRLNIWSWKQRLTAEEIAYVRENVEDV